MAFSFGKVFFVSFLLSGISPVRSEYEWKQNEANYREKRAIGITSITAVADTIAAGASLAGTTLSSLMGTEAVTVGIELDNYSKWSLDLPNAYPKTGHISVPPRTIKPGLREAMVVHKSSGSATGTWGTVSWVVGDTNKRIIVMWSAPYNFNHYSNWLAIGIIGEYEDGNSWANKMYYESGTFKRAEYYHNAKTIQYCDTDFCITGIMGTGHRSQVKLSFYPRVEENLSPKARASLQKDELNVEQVKSNESRDKGTNVRSGAETCENVTFIILANIGICFYIMI